MGTTGAHTVSYIGFYGWITVIGAGYFQPSDICTIQSIIINKLLD